MRPNLQDLTILHNGYISGKSKETQVLYQHWWWMVLEGGEVETVCGFVTVCGDNLEQSVYRRWMAEKQPKTCHGYSLSAVIGD